MEYITRQKVVTQRVLDETSGEIKDQVYEERIKKKRIKGGFRMVYREYDAAVLQVIKSQKDLEVLLRIRELFSKSRIEVAINAKEIAVKADTVASKVNSIRKKMEEVGLLKRVYRGIYRMNPYMYVPTMANAEVLQEEWNKLSHEVDEEDWISDIVREDKE